MKIPLKTFHLNGSLEEFNLYSPQTAKLELRPDTE